MRDEITQESLEEFKRLYLQEYGTELDEEEALEKLSRLLSLYRLVYLANPQEAVRALSRQRLKALTERYIEGKAPGHPLGVPLGR